MTCNELSNAQDRWLERVDRPGEETIEGLYEIASHIDRIDPFLRPSAVGATTLDQYLEKVSGGHRRTWRGDNLALWDARHVVDAEDSLNRELIEQTFLDHATPARNVLFGGLKNKLDGPVEFAALGEGASRAEQHRHVSVMTTSVHLPSLQRPMGNVVQFLERERIHVGTQTDRSPARSSPERADNAGAS
jgi:hypothetical protein